MADGAAGVQPESGLQDREAGAGEAARLSDGRVHDGELRPSLPPTLVLYTQDWSHEFLLLL